MKISNKIILLLAIAAFNLACKKERSFELHQVVVQLEYPQGSALSVVAGVKVKLTGNGSVFEGLTDAEGKVVLNIPSDVYDIASSETRKIGTNIYNYNALSSNQVIVNNWKDGDIITMKLQESKSSQLVIKEILVGGTPFDSGSSTFNYDGYIVIYNNSDFPCTTTNLCITATGPANAHATNNFYGTDGKLLYENENYIPAAGGFWYFTQPLTLQPGAQIVVAFYQAVNNTLTHSKSINFANPDYYAMYDMASTYKNATYYKSPSELIPATHYLKALSYSTGNAWTPGVLSPGLFIFEPKGITPAALASDASYTVNGSYKKIPIDWILDGVESFLLNNQNSKKRFLSTVDAGYVYHTNSKGYTVYRNVDKEATLAIQGNAGKIIYGYNLGTVAIGGSTDASDINAEASIKNGARIIYKDSNNSSNDMHLRLKASLSNY
ncbi:DUF4876 domain-containing protein [Pedobacter heparinus]|uniref:DUF4876 domain-containing protein n=1 Tax=Pedobacter heparinus TaxID=984 RepID=UPI00292DCFB6|nr:DUF4876 domain-containing protein [Pedobacter heparinus]